MNKKLFFDTQSGNKYLYSPRNSSFYFVPPAMEKEMQDLKGEESDFYKQKIEFWKKHGVFDTVKPQFTTHIEPEKIKRSVANLRQIVIEVTDGCNLDCKYCGYGKYYNNYDERTGKKQTFQNVRLLLDYLIEIWRSDLNVSYLNTVSIGFYGGEPLLNFPLIQETIEYLESLDLKHIHFVYNMTTNGVLLHKYMDFIAKKDFRLLISLDGNEAHNLYRITKKGENSFQTVFKNIKLLQDTYPDYFESGVNFNAVLHKHNPENDVIEFFKNNFNKTIQISQLSVNGIIPEKEEDFYQNLFQQRQTWFDKTKNKKTSTKIEELAENISVMQFASFINTYCGNTIGEYLELFENGTQKYYLPTGSCFPFERKIFITVNGKILPCERMGQNLSLATVKDNKIKIDYSHISDVYSDKYNRIIKHCNNCAIWKNCGQCVFLNIGIKAGNKCPSFISWKNANTYFSKLLSFAEKHKNLYEKLLRELIIS